MMLLLTLNCFSPYTNVIAFFVKYGLLLGWWILIINIFLYCLTSSEILQLTSTNISTWAEIKNTICSIFIHHDL